MELVRAICAPWGHGDYSSVEWAHPEIEFVIADEPTPWQLEGAGGDGGGLPWIPERLG